jgi:hypothetical protein
MVTGHPVFVYPWPPITMILQRLNLCKEGVEELVSDMNACTLAQSDGQENTYDMISVGGGYC